MQRRRIVKIESEVSDVDVDDRHGDPGRYQNSPSSESARKRISAWACGKKDGATDFAGYHCMPNVLSRRDGSIAQTMYIHQASIDPA